LTLRWTEEAEADRADIYDYIRAADLRAALRMDRRFELAANRLASFPILGREGVVSGTREFIPHPNYRLVYEIMGDEIWILTLIHVARQWPPVEPD
jgi:plasmid stabilization system protein ParE